MPEKNVDLHGSAPHKHKFALLLIDVINDFDFPYAFVFWNRVAEETKEKIQTT